MIMAPEGSTLRNADIETLFEDRINVRSDAAWMVKASIPTCAEVRDLVRGANPPPGRTCIVVKAKEYNGYAKRDVWEKLETWERD